VRRHSLGGSRRTFLSGAGAALVLAAPFVGRAAERTLDAGFVPSTLFAPLFVAQDRGYLSAAGAKSDLTPIVAGQDALALLATGRLDFIAAGLSAAFFNGVARGLDVRLVASTGYQPRHGHPSGLMVRRDLYDAGTRAPHDLRGKKIAFNGGAGATSAYYVARILRSAGLHLARRRDAQHQRARSGSGLRTQGDRRGVHLGALYASLRGTERRAPHSRAATRHLGHRHLLRTLAARRSEDRKRPARRHPARRRRHRGQGLFRRAQSGDVRNLHATTRGRPAPQRTATISPKTCASIKRRCWTCNASSSTQGILTYKTPLDERRLVARF
jgi:hypothetical protein